MFASNVLASGEQSSNWWQNLDEDRFGPAGTKGHLIVAIDPAIFGDPTTFRESVSAYLREIKESRKAPGVSEILIPGERSFRVRDKSLRDGVVQIGRAVWTDAGKLAEALGVAMPG